MFFMDRVNKGKSLLVHSTSYSVIDIETTGLSPIYDDIIEIGAIKVCDGSVVDTFSSLISIPYELPPYITDLTGITPNDLLGSPDLSDVLHDFNLFIGDDLLVGHNVNFDINFLYDNFEKSLGIPFKNDFVDTMRLSRQCIPGLAHYRLCDLSSHLNIVVENSHRALDDCYTTNALYSHLLTLPLPVKKARVKPNFAKEIHATVTDFDEDNPFFEKTCVLTGTLEKMTRKEACQEIVNRGGIIGNSVTKKTNYLVIGCNEYNPSVKDGMSSKQKKATALKTAGCDIELIPEDVFYELLFNN